MKLTPEELERLIKGISIDNTESNDKDFYDELDKDDCLGHTYPEVIRKPIPEEEK
jgi:hypothetical protein